MSLRVPTFISCSVYSGTASSLMCLVNAKEAGDPFPVRESMIVDGIGTMLAACFGSPFGTVMYLGQ